MITNFHDCFSGYSNKKLITFWHDLNPDQEIIFTRLTLQRNNYRYGHKEFQVWDKIQSVTLPGVKPAH